MKKQIIKFNTKDQNKFVSKFTWNKRLISIIPYLILTLIFVVIPLVIILIASVSPTNDSSVNDNWSILNSTIWAIIGKSIFNAIISTLICLIIALPFAYILAMQKNKLSKSIIIILITAPIWVNLLIKLIGLKNLLDVINQQTNSTHGNIFTIIGLVYIYTPFMIMPLYTALDTMPKNLINASKDLGRKGVYTFFFIVIPYCKNAILSGLVLVLLPSFTTVAVSEYLNNSNDNTSIGSMIIGQGEQGTNSAIGIARTSVLALVVAIISLLVYLLIVYMPKIYICIVKLFLETKAAISNSIKTYKNKEV